MIDTGECCPGCGWVVLVDSREELAIDDVSVDWWACDGDDVYCGQTGRIVGHVSIDRKTAEVVLYDHIRHACEAAPCTD